MMTIAKRPLESLAKHASTPLQRDGTAIIASGRVTMVQVHTASQVGAAGPFRLRARI